MLIDKNGKIFSKISVIDLVLLLVIIGLLAGYAFRTFSDSTKQIVNSNTKFYVTFHVDKVRDYTVNAIKEGDIFYEQHVAQSLGKVIEVSTKQAMDIIRKTDGTATYAPMEERYSLYITLECTGNVNASGYYINGNNHVSVGSDLRIKSNMILCGARIYDIRTD